MNLSWRAEKDSRASDWMNREKKSYPSAELLNETTTSPVVEEQMACEGNVTDGIKSYFVV